jgi:hypothetical protein
MIARVRFFAVASVIAVGAIGATTLVALALTMQDPNDSPGRLDVASAISFRDDPRPETSQRLLVHRVIMYDEWRGLDGLSRILIELDLDGDPQPERWIQIDASRDGSLHAEVIDRRGWVVGYARIWRSSDRALRLEFPVSYLGKPRPDGYRWRVLTAFNRPNHPQCGFDGDVYVLCGDKVPDAGWSIPQDL